MELSGLMYSGLLTMNSASHQKEIYRDKEPNIPLTVFHSVGMVASHSTKDMVKPGNGAVEVLNVSLN